MIANEKTLRAQLDSLPWIDGQQVVDRGIAESVTKDGKRFRYRVGILAPRGEGERLRIVDALVRMVPGRMAA